jgi:transcriptional regulator with XRE-family HTH domain
MKFEIKSRLKKLNLNQEEFAKKCGVSSVQVSKWVNGHAPTPVYAENILNLMESSGQDELIEKLTQLANILTDGHYTICKFTTNYRVSLGTPTEREHFDNMADGQTLNEAIKNLLKKYQELAWNI